MKFWSFCLCVREEIYIFAVDELRRILDHVLCNYYLHFILLCFVFLFAPVLVCAPIMIMITKYGSTLYIGIDEVFQHRAHTFDKFNLNF